MANLGYAGRRSAAKAATIPPLSALSPRGSGGNSSRLMRLLPLVILSIALLAWEWAVANGRVSALFFPAPTTIVATLVNLFWERDLLLDVGLTLYRMGVGFAIGATTGIVLGLLMGWSARVRVVMEPFIAGLHPMPKSAMLPLLLVLMGLGEQPRLALVALAAFFPLLINTMSSVNGIDPALLEAAANYGARGLQLFRRVILPAALPGILSGARIAANIAMTIAITTELLTARNGLGARIWMAWETLRTENLYATLIVIAIIGLTLNWLLVRLARWLMPWSPLSNTVEN